MGQRAANSCAHLILQNDLQALLNLTLADNTEKLYTSIFMFYAFRTLYNYQTI